MLRSFKIEVFVFVSAVCLVAHHDALGATKTLTFDDSATYGTANSNCVNTPTPPVFNRPGFGSQTSALIGSPAGCGEGQDLGTNGNDSLLTGSFSSTAPNSNELRFSWVGPTDDNSWVRVITATASGVAPHVPNPTVDIRANSSVSMDITVFGEDASNVENIAGQLEFSLIIRETGLNLPLGADGGTTGALEFVGLDCIGTTGSGCANGSPSNANTPAGGVTLTDSSTATFHNISWTFIDEGSGVNKVDIRIDNGAPTRKSMAAFPGTGANGILSAANSRGTLDSLAIRKPITDDTTKKWFVNVDNIVITAPGITDPVVVKSPLSDMHTKVVIQNIDPTATAVTLYDNAVQVAQATAPPQNFSSGTYTFTGLTLTAGHTMTATQTVGGNASPASAGVLVSDKVFIDQFTVAPVNGVNPPAGAGVSGVWYGNTSDTFGTVSGGTLNGSPDLHYIDSGFKNGAYAIYEGIVPATRTYQVTAKVHINEDSSVPNALTQWQLGVTVNGVHRVVSGCCTTGCTSTCCHQQSLLAVDTSLPGNAVANYPLTTGNDSGLGTQTLTTGEFTANEGDNLLIVFCTNVQTKWSEVAVVGPGTGDAGKLDTQDACMTSSCTGFPPVCTFGNVFNAQGTWNILPNRTNTSLNWTGANIDIDDIALIKPVSCTHTAPIGVQGPLVAGMTTVTATGVDLTATKVTIYDVAPVTPVVLGFVTGTPIGSATVPVTVSPALACNQMIVATQTVAAQEGCTNGASVLVCDCNQVSAVSLTGPLNAGVTSVTVTGVNVAATSVHVYDQTASNALIGQLTTLGGSGTETVTVSGLVKGHSIYATQTLSGLESCKPGPAQVVGSGGNIAVRLSLGIRETNGAGPIGADGGTASTSLEWIIPDDAGDPNDGQVVASVPRGKLITPGPAWQTVTFDPATAHIQSFSGGDGVLNGTFGVLEHLAIAADQNAASQDVGPYTLYIDNMTNDVTTFQNFDAITLGQSAVFTAPSSSGSTSSLLIAPPNSSSVVNEQFDGGSGQSLRVQWRWKTESANNWVRLTTLGSANMPNPQVNLTKQVTMRVLLLPPDLTVTAWRSVRTHGGGAGALPIAVNATATGNGLAGPTVETRTGGIQRVEVDFSGSVNVGVNAVNSVAVTDEAAAPYIPASVVANGSNGIAITFNAGQLTDMHCYHVVLNAGTLVETITGDSDCLIRSLIGDTTGSGLLNLSDVIYTNGKIGTAVGSAVAHDVDLSGGTIANADKLLIKGRVSKPPKQAICP